MLSNVRVVLVQTSHPGNIGAVARAMKTMALDDLALVDPKLFPSADATARASGADDVLARARVCTDLEQALSGCSAVLGASARRRALPWPELSPRESAILVAGYPGRAALVFGREHSGLTNAELAMCHYLVRIPCNETFSSLNLAAAVQVLAYEVFLAGRGPGTEAPRVEPPAPVELMEGYYRHLQAVLEATGFLDPASPGHLMRRLRRLYGRARPDARELNILRGMLTAVQKRIAGSPGQ